jgi:hypothetical protein
MRSITRTAGLGFAVAGICLLMSSFPTYNANSNSISYFSVSNRFVRHIDIISADDLQAIRAGNKTSDGREFKAGPQAADRIEREYVKVTIPGENCLIKKTYYVDIGLGLQLWSLLASTVCLFLAVALLEIGRRKTETTASGEQDDRRAT